MVQAWEVEELSKLVSRACGPHGSLHRASDDRAVPLLVPASLSSLRREGVNIPTPRGCGEGRRRSCVRALVGVGGVRGHAPLL